MADRILEMTGNVLPFGRSKQQVQVMDGLEVSRALAGLQCLRAVFAGLCITVWRASRLSCHGVLSIVQSFPYSSFKKEISGGLKSSLYCATLL
jgi:hypothetical protein